MIDYTKTETSTGKVLCRKTLEDNWWGTMKAVSIFSYSFSPKYPDEKTMVIKDRQRGTTETLVKI